MLYHFELQTKQNDFISLTDTVKKTVEESGVRDGLCVVYTPHTTAGLTITSFWDPKGFEDIMDEANRLIPTRIDFKHQHDTPRDAAGHIKSSLFGVSLTFIIEESKLFLGHSQGVFFIEFDGPRKREYFVKIIT
ncbi:MAG: secondary thiamine-phosphate synthase enzyme YjbQ [Spirochaetaceae bacterium]|jgi:secondary thiamine-phosphate synthase enzyme|nr:secondary thiamine-phosphate synthase enzyme YjbQ [Spirochaetaceae bacterium]